MILDFDGKTPDISKALFVADNATIIGDVTLEEGVSIWFGAVLRGDSGPIKVGKNTNIQDNSVVHVDPGGKVEIGENVTVGHNCIIHGCTVKDGALIGMGAIIMNHSVIGKNCTVGAGALVTENKEFPDNTVIVGSPAAVKKEMSEEQAQKNANNAIVYLNEASAYAGQKGKDSNE